MAVSPEILANGKGETQVVTLTPRSAIRAHCLECMGFNRKEISKCTSPLCALYPYRDENPPKEIFSPPVDGAKRHENRLLWEE